MIERFVPTDDRGMRLCVLQLHPERGGTPLVVLHGYLEQALAWRDVAARLTRPVWAIDHRGHGRSGHVGAGGWYHFWDYVSDLDAVLEALHPHDPVDLLGHSMGGTIACLFAGARPERVRRLVLVEGLGPPDSSGDGLVERARLFLAQRRRGLSHGPAFADTTAAAARLRKHNPRLDSALAQALAARATEPDRDGVRWRWDALHRGRNPRPFDPRHFVPFLEAIRAPTLVVDGGRSTFAASDRARHLRDATLHTFDEAGHLVHHDAPDALADAIERHLGR